MLSRRHPAQGATAPQRCVYTEDAVAAASPIDGEDRSLQNETRDVRRSLWPA